MLSAAAQQVLAQENRARLRAYADLQLPLELPSRRRGMLVFPLATLTWLHCRDLVESGNAFFAAGLTPTRDDYLEVLWRLHPYYRDDAGIWPNLRKGDRRPSAFRTWLSLFFLRLSCWNLDLVAAEVPLRRRLHEPWIDQPARRRKAGGPDLLSQLTPVNALDDAMEFLSTEKGWPLDECLRSPVAVYFQMLRVRLIAEGQGKLVLSAASHLLSFELDPEPTKGGTP